MTKMRQYTHQDLKEIPEDVVVAYDNGFFYWFGYWQRRWYNGWMMVSLDIKDRVEKEDEALVKDMIRILLKNTEEIMKKEGLENRVKGGIGYYEYLYKRIKDGKNIFKNSQFIYLEYKKGDKEQEDFFKQNGIKEPYPRASLGIRIAFRENDELVVKDENKNIKED